MPEPLRAPTRRSESGTSSSPVPPHPGESFVHERASVYYIYSVATSKYKSWKGIYIMQNTMARGVGGEAWEKNKN